MNEKQSKEKTIEKQNDFLVVKELPQQKVSTLITEDEKEIELITIEEAIGEILKVVRRLDKSL